MKNLATRIRPNKVNQIIGQSHLLNKDGILTKMIEKNYVLSCVFYGRPGIGKSTLAKCLSNDLKIPSIVFNASIDNKQKLVEIIELAKMHERFIVIIEEIHRLNKDKQDILLPLLENNNIFIFACTTENPYFVINPAIRSRCNVIELNPITNQEMLLGLKQVIKDHQLSINASDSILEKVAIYANGDIRTALNILDMLVNLYANEPITDDILFNITQNPIILGAHYGDEIHNLKSAFHKSLRGSDVDASLHYLARLIKLKALDEIARRMLACVYEDVGLANNNLCLRVSMGIESAYRLGFPECIQILGSLCIQIALSPKSNSAYAAIYFALSDLDSGTSFSIPKHLWDSHYASAQKLGVTGYKYPHDYKNHYVSQQYLPTNLTHRKYYEPDLTNEQEQKLNNWLKEIKKA